MKSRISSRNNGYLAKTCSVILAWLILLAAEIQIHHAEANGLIAFSSTRDGNWDIFVMNPDSTNIHNVTQHPAKDVNPSWAPNGEFIVFERKEVDSNNSHIWKIRVATGWTDRLTPDGPFSNRCPTWSPTGEFIAYMESGDPYLIKPDGNEKRMLAFGNAALFGREHTIAPFTWSPRGEFLAFAWSSAEAQRVAGILAHDIFKVGLHGGAHNLPRTPDCDERYPAWSPDGKRIAFIDGSGIFIMNVDGSNVRQLTTDRRDSEPCWAPNSRQIVFERVVNPEAPLDNRNRDIFIINIDGTGLRNLTNHPANDSSPNWWGLLGAVSSKGKRIAVWGVIKNKK